MIILLTVFLHLTAQVWHVSGKLYLQLAVLKLFGINGIPTKVTRYYPLVTLADARDVTYFKLRALSSPASYHNRCVKYYKKYR